MRIAFSEISLSGNSYEVHRLKNLAAPQDFAVKEPFWAHCTLKRKGDNKVEMQGRLQTRLSLTCDRCLGSYDVDVDTELQILFEVESKDSWQLQELERTLSDLDSIILDEPVVDLDDVLRQQLYLSLPLKSLCSERCKGLCAQCGINRNLAECTCAKDNPLGSFGALAKLKKKVS